MILQRCSLLYRCVSKGCRSEAVLFFSFFFWTEEQSGSFLSVSSEQTILKQIVFLQFFSVSSRGLPLREEAVLQKRTICFSLNSWTKNGSSCSTRTTRRTAQNNQVFFCSGQTWRTASSFLEEKLLEEKNPKKKEGSFLKNRSGVFFNRSSLFVSFRKQHHFCIFLERHNGSSCWKKPHQKKKDARTTPEEPLLLFRFLALKEKKEPLFSLKIRKEKNRALLFSQNA